MPFKVYGQVFASNKMNEFLHKAYSTRVIIARNILTHHVSKNRQIGNLLKLISLRKLISDKICF